VSADGLTAWIADTFNHRISVWTRSSANSTVWGNPTTFGTKGTGPSNFDSPYGVAVSADGLTAWIADQGNSRFSVWTRPSAESTAWTNQTTFGTRGSGPSNFASPTGVAVSADGLTAWISDQSYNRISVWTRPSAGSTAWTNQTTFGTQGSGPSNFLYPSGVAVSADGLTAWIADIYNNRMSVWTLS
jgi:DNA-binding beta-propeller fold protein YncE